jgi:CelD/BcsL family acetyltransferase involved in cellulose biosynthesis
MREVRTIDPLTDPRWLPFLDATAGATIFHHPQWIAPLMGAYGYLPASLGCFDGETLVGVLPMLEIRSRLTGRRGVSLPFSDYGGSVAASDDVHTQLLDAALARGRERGLVYVEMRCELEHAFACPSGSYKRHQLELGSDPDRLMKAFDKSQTQRGLNKFLKSGAVVERRVDNEGLRTFMQLNYMTRRKHGLPPQPDRFFDGFQKHILDRGMGFVSIARLGEQVLAACVFMRYKDTLYYKYGASDDEGLAHRPNHGIMWDAMRYGIAEGVRILDFGRSDLDGEGLIKFKRGWGTIETDITYAQVGTVSRPEGSGTGGGILDRLKPVIQRMPVPVLKVIGQVLYEHVG